MKRSLVVLTFVVLFLAAEESAYAQRQTKPNRKTSAAAATAVEPRWNKAELAFGNAVKVSLDAERLPAEFGGHDFVALFAALERAVAALPKDADAERQYQLLKTKRLLGDLTIDDSFVFKVQQNSDVRGYSPDLSRIFRAETFQLRQEKLIEPDRDMLGGCDGTGAGMNLPTGNAPEDFIKSFTDDAIWTKSYLLLNTVKPIYNRRSYRGKVETDSEMPPECRLKYIVPSPQAQYQLRFNEPQRFELAPSKTAGLSLNDYEYRERGGIGVIAWHAKGEKNPLPSSGGADDWTTTFFVVKIAAPFLKSEILTDRDAVENKEFKMFSRSFYVDIKSLWVVSYKTGKIIKKIGEN